MIRNLLMLFFLSIIIIGCAGQNDSSVPPKIILAQDPCDNCFMIINEEKFAASVWLENGEAKRFDDIGCMVSYVNSKNEKVKSYWVYDFTTKEPVNAEEAFFVRSDDLVTPMGNGIAAFTSRQSAQEFAEKLSTQIQKFNEFIKKQ